MIELFVNSLLPIFLIGGVGYLVGKVYHIDPRHLSQILFNVFTPCLVFDYLLNSKITSGEVLQMSGLAMLSMLTAGLLAWLLIRFTRLNRELQTGIVLTAMQPNCGNFGLPIILFAFGQEALVHASVFFTANLIFMYTVGVFVASMGSAGLRSALLNLIKMPAVYGVLVSIVMAQMGWRLPLPLERSISLLGQATIPSMLLLLGIQLQGAQWNLKFKALSFATVMRLISGPIVGLVICLLLGVKGPAFQAGVAQSAMPPAVFNIILASEYKLEPTFVSSAVFIMTLLSPLTLTPILYWLGG